VARARAREAAVMSAPALHGIVASAQSLASLAGVDVLRAGGTAMDAGIAMAAFLNVVDPAMTGIGGDLRSSSPPTMRPTSPAPS